jgi:adenosylhomocysteine nucleosidase
MTADGATYDLGLIIPTGEEFDYLRESVPFNPIASEKQGFWYEFDIPGGRRGVARVLFDMGLTATTSAASRLLDRFQPEVLAVVGIGGGLSPELRLGDVVVGSVIQEYLKAAKVAPGLAFLPAGDGWPLAERLRNFANHFPFIAENCYQSWVRFAKLRGIDADLPFATTPGARREPAYYVLPIASGDLVVTDPEFAGWLLSHDRKRAVIEMEAAGAARAVREQDRDVALLVLRGISDFADERKATLDAAASGQAPGAWRRYAAGNAIELLFAFLASPSFPWRTPLPTVVSAPGTPAPAAAEADAADSRARRAWEFFMQAHIIEAATAGIELWHSLRSGGEGRHGSDDHQADDHDHTQDLDHGHHAGHYQPDHEVAAGPDIHINLFFDDSPHYHDPHA